MRFRYAVGAAVGILLLLAGSGLARAQDQDHGFTFDVGFGATPLSGQISDRLTMGWHFSAAAGYRFSRHFDLVGRYTTNALGVSDAVLVEAQVPGGDANVWSVTAEPRLRLLPDRAVSPYLVGDVGYFRRTINFTEPTLQPDLLFDPFLGFFFPTQVPVDVVIGSFSRGGLGGGGGAGLEVRIRDSRVRFFAEARYEYGRTNTLPTRMIPVTVGFRW